MDGSFFLDTVFPGREITALQVAAGPSSLLHRLTLETLGRSPCSLFSSVSTLMLLGISFYLVALSTNHVPVIPRGEVFSPEQSGELLTPYLTAHRISTGIQSTFQIQYV